MSHRVWDTARRTWFGQFPQADPVGLAQSVLQNPVGGNLSAPSRDVREPDPHQQIVQRLQAALFFRQRRLFLGSAQLVP